MENITITKEEYETLKKKAEKWDELGSDIGKIYDNPEEGDMCDIGELAATAHGFM